MFHRKNEVLRNGTGLAVAGALVTVNVTGTSTKATLYATNDTTQPITNPVVTDPNGEYSYYVPDGIYDEVATYGSIVETETGIQIYDLSQAAENAADAEAAAQVALGARDEAVSAAATAGGLPTTRATIAAAVGPAAGRLALLTEAGREGMFVFDSSNLSAMVAADTAQGVYVAPTGQTGSTGAWVRQFEGRLNFEWFGAKTSRWSDVSPFDCLPSWLALKSYLNATLRNTDLLSGQLSGVPDILFPGEGYYFSDFLGVDHPVHAIGMNSGQDSGWNTNLIFASGKPGIIFNAAGTNGNVARGTPYPFSASGAFFDGFNVMSKGGDPVGTLTTDLQYSGVRYRVRANFRGRVAGFRGAGVCISGSVATPTSDPFYANINGWLLGDTVIMGCQTGGLFVSGGDGNAGHAYGSLDISDCRGLGLLDASFLSNKYASVELATCGTWGTFGGVAMGGTVHRSGRRYALRPGPVSGGGIYSHADAVASDPATSPAVWLDVGAGGIASDYPDWSATPTNTIYRPSGSAGTVAGGGTTVIDYLYVEGGQITPMISGAIVYGGFPGSGQLDGGPILKASAGLLSMQASIRQTWTQTDGTGVTSALGGDVSSASTTWVDLLHWYSSAADLSGLGYAGSLAHEKFSGDVGWMPLGARTSGYPVPFRFTGSSTSMVYGRPTGRDNRFITEVRNLALGVGDSARIQTSDTAAPTAGAHAQGEIVWNISPTAGGEFGWNCTAAGTPGTWTGLYSGYGVGPIGYATGAGGTVTQATSKATGVTLNKVCGEITLNAAALAASTAVSFTLTNSQIAAGDRIVLNHVSGGTFGAYMVDARSAAGSATIVVRNLSGGSLSEAIVLGFAVVKAVNA